MNAVEELMEALSTRVEAGVSTSEMQWSFSGEGLARVKAAATPSCDPFFADDTVLGVPYIVKGKQSEPFILHDGTPKTRRLVLGEQDMAQLKHERMLREMK